MFRRAASHSLLRYLSFLRLLWRLSRKWLASQLGRELLRAYYVLGLGIQSSLSRSSVVRILGE